MATAKTNKLKDRRGVNMNEITMEEKVEMYKAKVNELKAKVNAMQEVISALIQKYGVNPDNIYFRNPKAR